MNERRVRPIAMRSAPDIDGDGLDAVLRRIYAARGIADAAELDYALGALLPVSSMTGIDDAVDLVLSHADGRIVIVGDFDADGATSTALVMRCLREFGINDVHYLVPNRFHFGYGLTPEIVQVAARSEPALLITVDNGVSSVAGVAEANRLGIPVLVHGSLGGSGIAASAYVFRELGILPSATLTGLQANIEKDSLAFVPLGLLCRGLSNLYALANRLGLQNVAPKLESLLEPFAGHGVRIVRVADASLRETIEDACDEDGLDALVFCGADDDAFVDPQRRPRIVAIQGGRRSVLFEWETGATARRMILPDPCDVPATARWIRRALAGDMPVPYPLVNQLACCLFVSGYADDMSQAKAMAATKTGAFMAQAAMTSDSAGRTAARNAHR